MARYGTRLEDSIGWEIYQRWVRYASEHDHIPDPYVFYEKVLVAQDHYPITRGGFRHWLGRLQIPSVRHGDPYVWRDEITKAWRLRDVDVLEK